MKQINLLRTAALVLIAMSATALLVVSHPVQTISKLSALGSTGSPKIAYSPFPYGAQSRYQSAASDYLSLVTENGACRWTPQQMPIRVYIKDGSGTPGYRPTFNGFVANAFDEWCRVLGQRISWRQVATPREATVVVSWTGSTEIRNGGAEAGETQAVIETNRITGEHRIQSADIFVLTQLLGRSFNDTDINKICLHEVGHALGLQGHSNLSSDIMFPSVNPSQQPDLTQRDINTMERLYAGYNSSPAIAQQSQAPTRSFARSNSFDAGSARQNNGFDPGSFTPNNGPDQNGSIAQGGGAPDNSGYISMEQPRVMYGGGPGHGPRGAWRQGYVPYTNGNYSYSQQRAAMRRQAWQMARQMGQPRFSPQYGEFQQYSN